jgi:hypothetical protein
MRLKQLLCLALILSTWTRAEAEEKEKTMLCNFDADALDKVAKGFTNESGNWIVKQDDSAPSKANVVAQTASDIKTPYNLALSSESQFKDLDLSVKMKAIDGAVDQGGGLVWRAKDAKNYYVARFNPLEDNFRVYNVVDGKRTQLESSDVKAAEGWHTLRVTMIGDHIECYFDDKKCIDIKDTTLPDAGKIGLWTKADAQTHFDDLSVKETK